MGTVHAKEEQGAPSNVTNVFGGNSSNEDDVCNVDNPSDQKWVSLEGLQARVDRIHIDGLMRTKDDVVLETVKELFQAKDFQEVIASAHTVRGKLEGLGCFRNVGIFIDTSSGPGSTPNGLEVTFHVHEMKRVIGGINTLIGNNEGSLVIGMRMPNLLGRGEKLSTEYSYGSKRTTGFNVSLSKPLRGKMNSTFTSSIFQHGSEWPWSGYKQIERGLLFDVAFTSAHRVKHNVQWEASWRDLSCLSRSAAFQVREQTGPSLKSSIHHILCVDRRDASIFPTTGTLFQLTSEFAGFGGNVGFIKNEMLLQGSWPLTRDMVIQGAIQGGLLNHLTNYKGLCLCDKFYLGGPLNLRGFETRGVGPHIDGCSLGADAYWAAALHLYTPLPFKPGKGGFGDLFRTHCFFNTGNIGNFHFTDDYQHNLRVLATGLRMAYGIGLALRLGHLARVELNYCIPVHFRRGDRPAAGIQFGIGLQFL